MVNESDLCTIIKNSYIVAGGYMYKVPDPTSMFASTIARPFDLLGVFKGKPVYMEAKYSSKLRSFNLQSIEEHQIENLLLIKKLLPSAECIIALGIKVDRGDNRVYFFTDIFDIHQRRLSKQNYLKKELETLPYYSIHKGLISLD